MVVAKLAEFKRCFQVSEIKMKGLNGDINGYNAVKENADVEKMPPHFENENDSLCLKTAGHPLRCRIVSLVMPRNIKINDLRLVAKKGPQVKGSS